MKKTLRLFLCLMALLGFSQAGWSQQVSLDEALDVARGCMSGSHGLRVKGKVDPRLAYTAKRNGNVCYYVFNNGEDGGFVIVGGDERANKILAIVPEGSFNYDELPANVKAWMDEYEIQIDRAIRLTPEVTKQEKEQRQIRRAAKAPKTSIPEMITTKWSQHQPFSDAIYDTNGNHLGNAHNRPYVTGCVATAMAQVMNYWKYPTRGIGSHAYATWTNHVWFTADFENTTYDWAHMKDDYSHGYTEEEGAAVATLMYHCGVACEMDYNDDASGSGAGLASTGLRHYFGYSNSAVVYNKGSFTPEEWDDIVYGELKEGRPILYCGGSHAFVCHGYDASIDMYAINWGWSGSFDGYFAILGDDPLHPEGWGTGGDAEGYGQGQTIICNLHPVTDPELEYEAYPLAIRNFEQWDVRVSGSRYYLNKYDPVDVDLSAGDKTYVMEANLQNSVECAKNFDLAIMFVDEITGEQFCTPALEEGIFIGPEGTPADKYYPVLTFSTEVIPNSSMYNVYLAMRPTGGSDEDWTHTLFYPNENVPRFIRLNVTGRGIQHTKPIDMVFEDNSYGMGIRLPEDYQGNVTITSSDESIVSAGGQGGSFFYLNQGGNNGTAEITVEAEAYGIYEATTKTFTYTNKNYTTSHFGYDLYVDDITAPNAEDVISNISGYRTKVKSTMTTNGGKVTFTIKNDTWNPTPAQDIHIVVENQGDVWNEEYQGWDYVSQIYVVTYQDVEWDAYESKKFTIDLTSMAPLLESYDGNPNLSITPCFSYTMEEWGVNFAEVIGGLGLSATVVPTLNIPYTLSAAGWGTICLPYESEIPDGLEVYACDGVSNKTLLLTRVRKLEANTPYITSGTPGNYNFYGVQVDENSLQDTYSRGFLTGVLKSGVQIPSNAYLLQKKNDVVAFYRYVGAAANATQYRAFLNGDRLDGRYSSFYFPGMDMGNNEATGIENVAPAQSTMPTGIYDMQGRRIEQLQKGINILRMEDGSVKKVMVK